MQDFDTVMERLVDSAAFTPLQNADRRPAISLPLAESSAGLPVGMMLTSPRGREARLLIRLRTRRGAPVGADPVMTR